MGEKYPSNKSKARGQASPRITGIDSVTERSGQVKVMGENHRVPMPSGKSEYSVEDTIKVVNLSMSELEQVMTETQLVLVEVTQAAKQALSMVINVVDFEPYSAACAALANQSVRIQETISNSLAQTGLVQLNDCLQQVALMKTAGLVNVNDVETSALRSPLEVAGPVALTAGESATKIDISDKSMITDSLLDLNNIATADRATLIVTSFSGAVHEIRHEDSRGHWLSTPLANDSDLLSQTSTLLFPWNSRCSGLQSGGTCFQRILIAKGGLEQVNSLLVTYFNREESPHQFFVQPDRRGHYWHICYPTQPNADARWAPILDGQSTAGYIRGVNLPIVRIEFFAFSEREWERIAPFAAIVKEEMAAAGFSFASGSPISRGMTAGTEAKLNELRQLRKQSIRGKRVEITRIIACQRIGIDSKTVKKYAPMLYERWDDWEF